MLTISMQGAQALFDLLQRVHAGHMPDEAELEQVMQANAFFVDFYSQWDGSDQETIRQVICHFDHPERLPAGFLPNRLAEGFRQAVSKPDLIKSRVAWLEKVDASYIAGRVLAFLPDGTPLDSVIHITLDLWNNAFVNGSEMGVSLLGGATDPKTFEQAVTHELHHVGYRYWSEQDPVQKRVSQEKSGRAVGVLHVQNLFSEGMANYYCTPGYVFGELNSGPASDPYQARLARLAREEGQFFARAEEVLALCLKPEADYEACWEAVKDIAFDLEEAILPAGHYLGARMLQTMERVHPRQQIIDCVKRLPEFLPVYNEAASKTGGFVFEPQLAEQFARLWAG